MSPVLSLLDGIIAAETGKGGGNMDIGRAGGICGSFTVCIDSYHNGVPVGRFYSDGSALAHPFEGVTRCLRAMEQQMVNRSSKNGQ
jgi:hypothetical protein